MEELNKYTSSNLSKYQCKSPFAIKRIAEYSNNLVKLVTQVKHSYILNLGCGEGYDIKNIYEKENINIEYCCGLDLNFEALKMARQVLTNIRFDAIKGDINNLPIRPNKFNLLLCLEVLEHLSCPEKVLIDISCHFNGYCIFTVPNEPLYRLTRLLLYRKNIKEFGNHPEHLNLWSKKAFYRLISKYYIIDQVVTSFPWTIILCHKKDI